MKHRLVVKPYRGIGLMSGTSADGVDVALLAINQEPFQLTLEHFQVFPYPMAMRNRILQAFSSTTPLLEIGELNIQIGKLFADAALKLIKKIGKKPSDFVFIGSHGQTLFHRPPSLTDGAPFTMQAGDGSVIAERTGILTVSDFRMADIAQGGEGAPLIPYVDWKLYTDSNRNRVLLNLGGIANFTYLPADGKLQDVAGCDTGPANALIDSIVKIKTNGKTLQDRDGKMALKGNIHEPLLKELMAHPFIKRKAPKSADREMFGEKFARTLVQRYKLSLNDLLATAAEFTAQSIAVHLKKYPMDEIYVSGGGEKNRAVMGRLQSKFSAPVCSLDRLGNPGKAKEAIGFALLAYETLKGRPSNIPNVTGAKKAAVLGKISPGWNKQWKLL